MPSGVSGETPLEIASRLARSAGLAIEAIRVSAATDGVDGHHAPRPIAFTSKADSSPVTAADLAADRIIVDGLSAAFADDLVLSEESGLRGPRDASHLWIIDPLDGTEAFVDPKTRGYAVQIARARREGDRFVLELGVVYEPHTKTLLAATIGGPIRREIDDRVVPLPARAPAPTPPRLVTSTRISKPLRDRFLARGYADGGELRSVGIKVAHLLEGHADLYLATHGLAAWDLAAPQVLLEAAGGVVTDLDGSAPRYEVAALLGDASRTSSDLTTRREPKPREPQGLVFTLGLDHADALAALRRTH